MSSVRLWERLQQKIFYLKYFQNFASGNKMSQRPSWDEYFLRITREVAQRSTCLRRQVGAVMVMDKHILTTGYNGARVDFSTVWILAVCGSSSRCLRGNGTNSAAVSMPR